jgi:hypothetical protein
MEKYACKDWLFQEFFGFFQLYKNMALFTLRFLARNL